MNIDQLDYIRMIRTQIFYFALLGSCVATVLVGMGAGITAIGWVGVLSSILVYWSFNRDMNKYTSGNFSPAKIIHQKYHDKQ